MFSFTSIFYPEIHPVKEGFIVGFDDGAPSIFQRQIDFIQKNGIVTAMVGILQAPTGTSLYDRLKSEGYVLGNMSGDTDGTTNIIPRMDLNSLRGGYHWIMNQIYSPKHYFEHIKSLLREYKYPKAKISLDFQRIMVFFRSNIRLGVFGRERFQYWKIMAWTLSRRPSLLPLAITSHLWASLPEDLQVASPIVMKKRLRWLQASSGLSASL
jgi:hypothetical protein